LILVLATIFMPRGLWDVAQKFFARPPKPAPTAAEARQPA
jgi:hypothetical protein